MNGEELNVSQELSPEQIRERAGKLLESARPIKDRLEATNTPEDRLEVEDTKVRHKVTTDRGQEQFEAIVGNDTVYLNKWLTSPEGVTSWLQITQTQGHDEFRGTLTHHTHEDSASTDLLRLTPNQIQATLRTVMDDLEGVVSTREQVTSQAQDAEVMHILGLSS